MRRFLIDSFNAAYGLYQDIKTGNYREDREADELALKKKCGKVFQLRRTVRSSST